MVQAVRIIEWWARALGDCLPPGLVRLFGPRPVQLDYEGGDIAPVLRKLRRKGGKRRGVRIAVAPSQILAFSVAMPAEATADRDSAIALQLPERTGFEADDLLYSVAPGPEETGTPGMLLWRVTATPKAGVFALRDRLEAKGFRVRSIAPAPAPATKSGRPDPLWRRPPEVGRIVALLALFALMLGLWWLLADAIETRRSAETGALRAALQQDMQRARLDADAIQALTRDAARRQRAQEETGAAPSPLAALNRLAQILPEDSFLLEAVMDSDGILVADGLSLDAAALAEALTAAGDPGGIQVQPGDYDPDFGRDRVVIIVPPSSLSGSEDRE